MTRLDGKTRWKLEVEQGDCGICDLCAIACSMEKYGVSNPDMSAIKIHHRERDTNSRSKGAIGILPCWHCVDPPCFYSCPYDSMYVNEFNVVNIYLTDAPEGFKDCTACMKCVKACEEMHGESSIFISIYKDRPMKTKSGREIMKYSLYKCDMCGGDPACVKICPRDAIRFVIVDG